MRCPPSRPRDYNLAVMTAMIDVVLWLLIFFVVTSGQSKDLLLPANLASSGTIESVPTEAPETAPEPLLWVHLKHPVGEAAAVEVQGQTFHIDSLQTALTGFREQDPQRSVVLKIDPNVPLGDVVSLYDAAQSAGFETVKFAATPAK